MLFRSQQIVDRHDLATANLRPTMMVLRGETLPLANLSAGRANLAATLRVAHELTVGGLHPRSQQAAARPSSGHEIAGRIGTEIGQDFPLPDFRFPLPP